MAAIERRSSVRKSVRMACQLRFPSGVSINGITRNMSLDGVEVEASSVSGNKERMPTPGESGLLALKFRHAGSPDSIMAQCQVVHILASGMGLSARFVELGRRQQEMLGRRGASGRAQIGKRVAA
jgi:hypothetical protein